MHQNKTFFVLESFSKKEMTRFFEFCHAPYHNKHKGVQVLVTYLAKCYPHFTEKNCAKAKLRKLFPNIKDSELALILTYTRRVLYDFLAIEGFRKDSAAHSIFLLKELRWNKINHLYEKELKKAKQKLPMEATGNTGLLQAHYRLSSEADIYFRSISKRKDDSSLQTKQRFLDYFFIAEKLKDAIEMHLREQILQVEFSQRMLFSALKEVEENWEEYLKVPLITIYYQLYQLVTKAEESFYFDLILSLRESSLQLPKMELAYIYNILQNFCISQINTHNKKFLLELFKLYQSELELDLLLDDGVLIEWHYKNIVTTALRLNEIEWTEKFIEDYKHKLSPAAFENAYYFNLATLYHAKGAYDKVLDLLTHVEYNDLRYNLGAKALLLRTYYELGETTSLISLSVAFKQFLKRNKLMSETRKNAYSHLFSFTEKLAILRDEIPYKTKRQTQLKFMKIQEQLNKAGTIFNQAWLERQIKKISDEIKISPL